MDRLWFETALLPEGWARGVRIGIQDGLIATIDPEVEASREDDCGAIAIPGLCNVHSHAFQRGLAGLTERRGAGEDDFWTWREAMYGFLERLSPEDVEAISTLAYCEMVESGFTRVGEFHYLHHDAAGRPYADPAEMTGRIVSAAEASGIGLSLLPVFYAHGGFGGAPPTPGQRRFLSTPESYAGLLEASRRSLAFLPDATLGVAPHSLRAVTSEELALLAPLAGAAGIHIHAAEQQAEVEACLAWSGERPVGWLLDHGGADEAWRIIHATHMISSEVDRLAASGAVAGLCPITEADLGDGIFPSPEYLGRGGRMGVGSDSNVRISAAGELRALEYAQRLARRRRNLLAGEDRPSVGGFLFRAALTGGGQALGVRSGLYVGAPLDLVELDGRDPTYAAARDDALLDAWIFAGGRIDRVWRRGHLLVLAGRHLQRSAAERRFRAALERMFS